MNINGVVWREAKDEMGRSVWINVSLARTIRRDPKGRGTLVSFDHQHSISVETAVTTSCPGHRRRQCAHAILIVSPLALAAGADEQLVSLVVELLDRSLAGLPSAPSEHRKGRAYRTATPNWLGRSTAA